MVDREDNHVISQSSPSQVVIISIVNMTASFSGSAELGQVCSDQAVLLSQDQVQVLTSAV